MLNPLDLKLLMTASLAVGVLASCAPVENLPRFNSDLEKQCYLEADAALGRDNLSLVRKGDTFVEVVTVDGFVRDTRTSDTFELCMAKGFGDNAPNKLSETGSLRFTGEEQKIWDGLNDAEKQLAYQSIRNGSTLSDWAAGR